MTADDADAIVRVVDPSRAVVLTSFPVSGDVYNLGRASAIVFALVAAGATVFGAPLTLPLVLGVLAAAGALLALRMHRQRTVIRIGNDGIALHRTSDERFFPIASLESCELLLDHRSIAVGVRLVMRLGPPEDVQFPGPPGGRDSGPEQLARAVKAAIDRRLAERGAELPSRHDVAASLLPAWRPTPQWVSEVLAQRGRAPTYRDRGAVETAELLSVVEDTHAAPMLRVVAAIGSDGSPETRLRIREAAARSAEPRLERALIRIAEDAPAEEIAAAVAELHEEREPAKAP